jgi:alpha-glucosidase
LQETIMPKLRWWQTDIIYQIYPRSFQDSDGDGVGDLNGIVQRLDYLTWLGIDAIWLSPIFPSPMADFGYDISNYTDIDEIFGTLADFDRLLDAAHHKGVKVILDFVPNHTSDQHPWFLESRSSRASRKRDWYIWRSAAGDGGPPNNWLSVFGGSAWELDEASRQYYYHAFLKEQPDLNWRNREVRAAMYDVLRFWLERGVDGFRVDVIWHLIKDGQFRDNPPNLHYRPGQHPYASLDPVYATDRPEVHEVISEMRQLVDSYEDRVLIGEIYLPVERLVTYYGIGLQGVHLPFNFQLLQCEWNARAILDLVRDYEAMLPNGGWPNWVLGNHDNHRIATRVDAAQARVAAMLLLTLRGTPTIYYGDEIGMQDAIIPQELVQDPFEKRVPGIGVGRDPARTPMQWDASVNAGFTRGTPWLPVADGYDWTNVAAETADPRSALTLYRRLIEFRRQRPDLMVGDWQAVAADGDVLAYARSHAGSRLLVALNLGATPHRLALPRPARVLLSTHLDRAHEAVSGDVELRGNEGVILGCNGRRLPSHSNERNQDPHRLEACMTIRS